MDHSCRSVEDSGTQSNLNFGGPTQEVLEEKNITMWLLYLSCDIMAEYGCHFLNWALTVHNILTTTISHASTRMVHSAPLKTFNSFYNPKSTLNAKLYDQTCSTNTPLMVPTSVLGSVLLLWRVIIAIATLLQESIYWRLDYNFTVLVSYHHDR